MIRSILIATIYLFGWKLSCIMSIFQIWARQGSHRKTWLVSNCPRCQIVSPALLVSNRPPPILRVNSVSSLNCGATSFSDGIFNRMVLKYQLISQVVFEGSSSIDIWLSSWNPVQSFLIWIKLIAVQLQRPIIRSSDNLLLDLIWNPCKV